MAKKLQEKEGSGKMEEKKSRIEKDEPEKVPKDEESERTEKELDLGEEDRVPEERKDQLPTEHFQPVPGTEEEAPDDVAMPRLRLLQSTSTEVQESESQPGKLRHSLSGEEWDKVEVIPLCLRKSRIHFDPENIKGAPICFAPDAVTSRSGHRCLTGCPHENAHLWANNDPPRCDIVKSFPCLILVNGKLRGDFASLAFVRSSIPASQKLIYLRWKSGKPYWNFVYEIFTKQKTFQKGMAYIFDIRQVRETKPQERQAAAEIFNSIRVKPVAEAEVAGGEDSFEK